MLLTNIIQRSRNRAGAIIVLESIFAVMMKYVINEMTKSQEKKHNELPGRLNHQEHTVVEKNKELQKK